MKNNPTLLFVRRNFLTEHLFTTIKKSMINLISVKFAWSVLDANQIFLLTLDLTLEKNLTNVLLVIKGLLTNIHYKDMRQLTVMRKNSSAKYALMKDILRPKVNWDITWFITMSQNIHVFIVKRNFTLHRIWLNTWNFISNLHILVQNVVKSFIHQQTWKATKRETHASFVSRICF